METRNPTAPRGVKDADASESRGPLDKSQGSGDMLLSRGQGPGERGDHLGAFEICLMGLLALLTGCLPLLTRKCTSAEVSIKSQVMACEIFKVAISASTLLFTRESRSHALRNWKMTSALVAAGIPSLIYALQNTLLQISVRNLDSVSFSLLYQTRLISTAFCNYVFLGKCQSKQQMTALLLLSISAILLTLPASPMNHSPPCNPTDQPPSNLGHTTHHNTCATNSTPSLGNTLAVCTPHAAPSEVISGNTQGMGDDAPSEVISGHTQGMGDDAASEVISGHTQGMGGSSAGPWGFQIGETLALGVLPVLLASVTSGLGSAYCQWILQVKGHSFQLFSVELGCMSLFLLSTSSLLPFWLPSSPSCSSPSKEASLFASWSPIMLVPPLANALAGILVGLVTKYAGGVSKGLCAIGGLLVAALAHGIVEGTPLVVQVWVALPLVALSMYLYFYFPYKPPQTKQHSE